MQYFELKTKRLKTKKRANKASMIFVIALMFFFNGAAQNIEVEISPKEIHIGERVTLSFSIPVNGEIIEPMIVSTDTLELININYSVSKQAGKQVAQFKALFTSFIEGSHLIPSLTIVDVDTTKAGQTKFYTDSIGFIVIPFAVDTTKIETKDIKPIMTQGFSIDEILPLIWLFLALIGVGLGLYFFMRYRKKRQPLVRSVISNSTPQEPADIKALRALETLKLKKLAEQGFKKRYYSEMTDILRIFLTERFAINALEMTTSEIIIVMQQQLQNTIEKDNLSHLQYLFSTADLVKFAKHEPSRSIDDECIELSKRVIVNVAIKREEADNV